MENTDTGKEEIIVSMRELYPHASEELIQEGYENLSNYLDTAWSIAERMVNEKEKSSTSDPVRSVDKNVYEKIA